MKVFLGGTTNESTWRDTLIPLLQIDYFNPVVDIWNHKHQVKELLERKKCDYLLYVITPKMAGCYSIAEVTEDCIKQPRKTILCVLQDDEGFFSEGEKKSLKAVEQLVEKNGAQIFSNLNDVAKYLNSKKESNVTKIARFLK